MKPLGLLLLAVTMLFPYSAQKLYFTTDGTQGGTSVEPGFDFNHIWNALGVGKNGRIYIAVSNTLQSEPGGGSPQKGDVCIVEYNPYTNTLRSCGTVKKACQAAGNWMSNESQEKIHTGLISAPDGKLWMATHDNAEVVPGDPLWYSGLFYRGTHLLYVDVFNGDTLVDYSPAQTWYYKKNTPSPTRMTHGIPPSDTSGVAIQWHSIMILGINPYMPRYLWTMSICGNGYFMVWDRAADSTRVVAIGDGSMREFAVGRDGSLYTLPSNTAYKRTPRGAMKIIGTSLVGGHGTSIYSHAFDSAFVFARGTGEITLLDMAHDTAKQIANLPDEGTSSETYRCAAISADGKKIYVIGASNSLYEVTVATGAYSAVYNLGSATSGYYMISGRNIIDTLGNMYAGMHNAGEAALLKINVGKDLIRPLVIPDTNVSAEMHAAASAGEALSVSPNPFSGETTIRWNGTTANGDVRVSVYGLNGRLLSTGTMSGRTLSRGWRFHAPSAAYGVFLVRVQGAGLEKTAAAVRIR